MTFDARDLYNGLRKSADNAAAAAKLARSEGRSDEAEFHSGRHAGLVTAIGLLRREEDLAAQARDAELRSNMEDEALGEAALAAGVIGYGTGVDLAAVASLEEFARNVGGAFDGVGTVYSDAGEGL